MPDGPNLFARLHKWAARQDENFMTESLAVVLETLLEREPTAGARLVALITGGFVAVDEERAQTLEIRTQVSTTEGRPDLEIRLPDRLAVVEVKVESPLRRGQLEGYREYLRTTGLPRTWLVLLTKYPADLTAGDEYPDQMLRWYEAADGLERELDEPGLSDPVCNYLCQQFLEFLKERNMSLAQVGWQLPEGTRALRNFLVMLEEAAKACQVNPKRTMSLDSVGFRLDGGKYWVGLLLETPQLLRFGTRCKIDRDAAERLGVGEITEEKESWVPGRYRWWRMAELGSEEVYFYARSKVGQIQWLEEFLRDCLAKARSIETPDQPPIPDGPEGD